MYFLISRKLIHFYVNSIYKWGNFCREIAKIPFEIERVNACVLHKFGCLSEIQMPNKNGCPILSIMKAVCRSCMLSVNPQDHLVSVIKMHVKISLNN